MWNGKNIREGDRAFKFLIPEGKSNLLFFFFVEPLEWNEIILQAKVPGRYLNYRLEKTSCECLIGRSSIKPDLKPFTSYC